MKKNLLTFLILVFFAGCDDNNKRNVNPFLPDYSFSYPINLNLPSFYGLRSNINPVYLSAQGLGVKGIVILRISDTEYRAWEAACPNQAPSECSLLKIVGLETKCDCDNQKYNIFTGVGAGQYTMKPYQVEILNPENIRVFN